MRILTGIDLPFLPSCGSIILCNELYASSNLKDIEVRFLGLTTNEGSNWSKIKDVALLNINKNSSPEHFVEYKKKLIDRVEYHVKEFKPDVIHIQHLSFGLALAFATFTQIPKIAICHGTGILFALNDQFHKFNVEQVVKSSQCVVFPTKNIFEKTIQLLGDSVNFNHKIIPWGLPNHLIEQWKERKWGMISKKILYAGRLTDNKNVSAIIYALSLMEDNETLTIIGEGEAEEKYKKLVDSLGLTNRVHFRKFYAQTQLWSVFDEFDVLVIPSRSVEAFCLIAIEAQSHGLPVVYASNTGMDEVLGKSAIPFNPEDPSELSKILSFLLSSNHNLEHYSQAGISNSKKYPLSKTRESIMNLSKKLAST